MAKVSTESRYQRVLAILDAAAAGSKADYGIGRPFWHEPLPKLLDLRIHGVRVIAAADKAASAACPCCEPQTQTNEDPPFPGRGARSGLVRGLRGEPPFDGSQYPRLPWGGDAVAADDIDFISNWIDDGCPAEDHQTSIAVPVKPAPPVVETIEAANVESAVQTFGVYEGSPNEYTYAYGEVKQRMNLDCMDDRQIAKLREAFREMYRLNKWPEDIRSYNNLALIHQNHCQHGWERFLPWHRIYLYEFEQVLQDLVPGVTLPYWDFTMPQYVPSKPEDGDIIPNSFKAFLTDESVYYLEHAVPAIGKSQAAALRKEMVGELYTSTTKFFKAVEKTLKNPKYIQGEHRNRFIDALLASNSLWYPLRYPGEYYDKKHKKIPVTQKFNYHYPTADDMDQILSLRTFRDFGGGSLYNDSFGYLDQNPHNTMHIWTGGQNAEYDPDTDGQGEAALQNRNRGVVAKGRVYHSREDMYQNPKYGDMLSNLTASFDPVFWPIHSNIDRTWVEWQQRNPHAQPADLDAVLTPWSYTIRDTLDWTRFGYEYVKCSYVIPVGLAAPVGRFVSKPIEIPAPARKSFRQAEVRLHRVPQLPRSCFIRVFLNLPEADASTSIEHGNYAGYLAIFGHGPCIGGPGHCELPPPRARQYDLRPRSHNTPRNHRINVTKTARQLLDAGAKSLQITLVVIGADYDEDTELLRVDGVSLDFLD